MKQSCMYTYLRVSLKLIDFIFNKFNVCFLEWLVLLTLSKYLSAH